MSERSIYFEKRDLARNREQKSCDIPDEETTEWKETSGGSHEAAARTHARTQAGKQPGRHARTHARTHIRMHACSRRAFTFKVKRFPFTHYDPTPCRLASYLSDYPTRWYHYQTREPKRAPLSATRKNCFRSCRRIRMKKLKYRFSVPLFPVFERKKIIRTTDLHSAWKIKKDRQRQKELLERCRKNVMLRNKNLWKDWEELQS